MTPEERTALFNSLTEETIDLLREFFRVEIAATSSGGVRLLRTSLVFSHRESFNFDFSCEDADITNTYPDYVQIWDAYTAAWEATRDRILARYSDGRTVLGSIREFLLPKEVVAI